MRTFNFNTQLSGTHTYKYSWHLHMQARSTYALDVCLVYPSFCQAFHLCLYLLFKCSACAVLLMTEGKLTFHCFTWHYCKSALRKIYASAPVWFCFTCEHKYASSLPYERLRLIKAATANTYIYSCESKRARRHVMYVIVREM